VNELRELLILGGGYVAVIDSNDNSFIFTNVGTWGPTAYNPTNDEIYTLTGPGVEQFNASTLSLIGNESLYLPDLADIAYSPATREIYVSSFSNSWVYVIDHKNKVSIIDVGYYPETMMYNPANKDLYVSDILGGTVTVINSTDKVIATVPVGTYAYQMFFDPANNDTYVADDGGPVAVVSSENTLVSTLIYGVYGSFVYDSKRSDVVFTTYFLSGCCHRHPKIGLIDSSNNTEIDIERVHSLGIMAYDKGPNWIYIPISKEDVVEILTG